MVPCVIRRRAVAALAVCLVAVLPTAGCYQGFEGTVNTQEPTGNGTDFVVGTLKVQDTTLVADTATGRTASLLMTIINEGDQPDALTGVTVGGTRATLRTAPLAVAPGATAVVGGTSPNQVLVTGLQVPAGSYADVTVEFRSAGSDTRRVLVVPAVGYYADFGPRAAAPAA
jgi:hypothetical protein